MNIQFRGTTGHIIWLLQLQVHTTLNAHFRDIYCGYGNFRVSRILLYTLDHTTQLSLRFSKHIKLTCAEYSPQNSQDRVFSLPCHSWYRRLSETRSYGRCLEKINLHFWQVFILYAKLKSILLSFEYF